MAEVHDMERRALEYIRNAGGAPEINWFDDDHDPIGPQLREQLGKKGMVQENEATELCDATITLTPAGEAAISVEQFGLKE